jgi:hypothetical protein
MLPEPALAMWLKLPFATATFTSPPGRVAVPHLGEAGAATVRMVLAGAAEDLPGRELLGVLQL